MSSPVAVSLRSISIVYFTLSFFFFFSSRRRHTRSDRDWSSDVCSSDLDGEHGQPVGVRHVEVERVAVGQVRLAAIGVQDRDGPRRDREVPAEQGPQVPEIGRASWRGRGEISVGAGSFKKKKRHTNSNGA